MKPTQITIAHLREIIENKRILLVTNKNSYDQLGFHELIFGKDERDIIHFKDFELNPKLEDILSALQHYNFDSIDAIVGVGGGSAMDMAKSLHYFSNSKDLSLNSLIEQINKPTRVDKKKPFVLIPTTCGSGSEATHFSVIYYKNKKYSLASPDLIPDYTILSAKFIQNLPPKILAYTGMDAICHAIESFWAKGRTDESISFSLKALNLLVPNIVKAIKGDTAAKESMIQGSFFAGKAINISKTTAPHALSYYLTSHKNIPHGQAVALMVPHFIREHGEVLDLEPIMSIFSSKTPKSFASAFKALLEDLSLNLDVGALLKDEQEPFIDSINLERLSNNPKSYSKADLRALIFGS